MGCCASNNSSQADTNKGERKKKKGVHNDRGVNENVGVAPGSSPTTRQPPSPSEDVDATTEEGDQNSLLSSISDLDEGDGQLAASFTPQKSIEQQREESMIDFGADLFQWDDATVNLKDLRSKEMMKKSFIQHTRKPPAAAPKPRGKNSAFQWSDISIDADLDFQPTLTRRESKKALNVKPVPKSPSLASPLIETKLPASPSRVKREGQIANFKLSTLVGHSSRVKCIAVNPNESEYISCSNEDSLVTYYDLKDGRELGIFSGHQDTVIFACFSPCGKFLATTSRDNTLMLWDVVTQKVILTFEHSKVVICCAFSKDSKLIATGCQDKVCRLWETRKGRELLAFTQHEGIIISLSFSPIPDDPHIVSCSADKTLRMWTTTKGKSKLIMRGHAAIILSCQYSADGKRIVSNDDRLAKVWNASDGTCILTLNVENFVTIRNMAMTKKLSWTLSCAAPGKFANYFVVACNNRFVFVVNMETGKEELCVDTKAPVYCLTAGYQNLIAFGDSFGNIYTLRLQGFYPEDQ